MSRTPFDLILDNFSVIAPNIKHFIFRPSKPITFIPGQFITLHIPVEDKTIRRSYSLANPNSKNSMYQLELAASYVPKGVASEYLFNMKQGDSIEATGPFGRLILRDEAVSRYLLIATGTGVTPYLAMLPDLATKMNQNPKLKINLFFGVRTPQDMLYRNEFVTFSKQYPRFQLYVYYSRLQMLPELPYEYQGYVSHAFKNRIQIIPEEDIVYLCGNPNMIDDMVTLLTEQGLKTHQIRREKYISSK